MTTLTIRNDLMARVRQLLADRNAPKPPKPPKPRDEVKTGGGEQNVSFKDLFELYGTPIPRVKGNIKIEGKPLYARDAVVQNGKKKFYGAYHFGEARGSTVLVRLWLNKTLVYDIRDEPNPLLMSGLKFRFYIGTNSQSADPILVEDVGASSAQAYRHLTTIWFDGLDLESVGGSFPFMVEAEIWENATITTNTVVPSGSTTPAGTFAVDWESSTLWIANDTDIYKVDLSTDTVVDTYAIDHTVGPLSGVDYTYYLPWLDLLMMGGVKSINSPAMNAVDPHSGVVLAQSETISFGINSIAVPLKVTAPNGAIETYMVAATPNAGTAQIFEYADGFTKLSHTGHTSDPINDVVAGPEKTNESWAYIVAGTGASTVINKIAVYAGGTTLETEAYAAGASIASLWYDSGDGGLVISYSGGSLEKRQALDGSFDLIWSITPQGTLARDWHSRNTDTVATFSGPDNTADIIDLTTGDITQETGLPNPVATGALLWDEITYSMFNVGSFGSGAHQRTYLSAKSSNRQTLRACLEDLFDYHGYASSEYDFSEVTDSIDNSALFENISLNAVALDARRAFDYLFVDSDKMYFKASPASGTSAADHTLADGDYVLEEGGENRAAIQTTQEDRANVPQKAEISYIADVLDYNWTQANAARQTFPKRVYDQSGVTRLRLPFGLQADEAALLTEKLVTREHIGKTAVAFKTGLRHLEVEPGDTCDVTSNGRTRKIRVDVGQTIDIHGGTITNECRAWTIDYVTEKSGSAGTKANAATIGNGASRIYPLMLPLQNRGDDLAGTGLVSYVVVTSQGQGNWSGGQGLVSLDGGETWSVIAEQQTDPTFGRVRTALADTDTPHSIDETGSITVVPINENAADFASVTYLQQVNGQATVYAIGENGRWEIIAPRTWTDNGDGSWTGTNIMRAMLGSEPFTGTHQGGDWFFALNSDYLHLFTVATSRLNDTALFKAVGLHEPVSGGTGKLWTFDGNAEKPYMPHALTATYGSGPGLDLDWERQVRANWPWEDGTDTVPLLQVAEYYKIDLLDGPGGAVDATYGEDLSITSTSYNVPQATLVTLYGTVPATLTAKVYQRSDISSLWGYGREITISTT